MEYRQRIGPTPIGGEQGDLRDSFFNGRVAAPHRLCGTIEAELIDPLSTTGTNSEVAARDQIRPIATTIPRPIHPMRI
jgi:hypothetical protein